MTDIEVVINDSDLIFVEESEITARGSNAALDQVDNHECSICGKQFRLASYLKLHNKRVHGKSVNATTLRHEEHERKKGSTSKTSTQGASHVCQTCGREFSTASNLHRHHRKVHKQPLDRIPSRHGHPRCGCGICGNDLVSRTALIKHLKDEHDIVVKTEELTFPDMESFLSWKSKIQVDSKSDFKRKTDTKNKQVSYICTRSGYYIPHGSNIRKLKEQGTRKIGGVCPARILVIEKKDSSLEVKYTRTHAGHKIESSHLQLTKEIKDWILKQLQDEIPPSLILKMAESQFPRAELLNRKHIHNIATANGLTTTKGFDLDKLLQSNAVSVVRETRSQSKRGKQTVHQTQDNEGNRAASLLFLLPDNQDH